MAIRAGAAFATVSIGRDGSKARDRMRRNGYPYNNWAGENIICSRRSAEAMVQWWLNSPPHRRNILHGHFRHIGVGVSMNGQWGADGVLVFAGLTIDPSRREVTAHAGPVHLSALEFDVLTVLAGSPGRVFSRAQLLERVWGYDYFGDERVVDVHIRSIRRALGDDVDAPRFIGTVRGVGYKCVATPVPGRP